MKKEFDGEHIATMGLDFAKNEYTTKHDGQKLELKVWDTAGQDRFKHLTYSFYKKADGIIVAFDTTEQKSFENIKTWVENIDDHAKETACKKLIL